MAHSISTYSQYPSLSRTYLQRTNTRRCGTLFTFFSSPSKNILTTFIPHEKSLFKWGQENFRLNINFISSSPNKNRTKKRRLTRVIERNYPIFHFLCVWLVWKTVKPDYDKFRFKFILRFPSSCPGTPHMEIRAWRAQTNTTTPCHYDNDRYCETINPEQKPKTK